MGGAILGWIIKNRKTIPVDPETPKNTKQTKTETTEFDKQVQLIERKNEPGTLTIFPECVPHYTTKHSLVALN